MIVWANRPNCLLLGGLVLPQTTTTINTTFLCNFPSSGLTMSSSSSSSSVIGSQGVVVATAMALSGTVILLALRLQKSLPPPLSSPPILRSCQSSERKKGQKKKKKRVHFAADVVDSRRDGEEFRRKHRVSNSSVYSNSEMKKTRENCNGGSEIRGIPANRMALYNGILRDRVAQRLAYSY